MKDPFMKMYNFGGDYNAKGNNEVIAFGKVHTG